MDYDGTVLKSETLEYDSGIVKPNDPTRTGYTFTGWSPSVASTVTDNLTYTAQYSINYYKISFVGYTDFEGMKEERIEYALAYDSDVASSITPPAEIKRTGHDFIGWDIEIPSRVPAEDVTIIAQYRIQVFTITWTLAGASTTTTCEYGKSPTPPAGVNKEDVLNIGGVNYIITGYSPELSTTITGNTHIKVVATKHVSTIITARPTKVGANQNMSYESFLAGTGELKYSAYGKIGQAILYGFNFEELREKSNVQISDMVVNVIGNTYSGSSVVFQFIRDFNTTGSDYSSYTDLGDGQKSLAGNNSNDYITLSLTQSDLPNTFNWIKNNITDFINGYTSNTFGMYFRCGRCWVKDATISITCSYTETVVG